MPLRSRSIEATTGLVGESLAGFVDYNNTGTGDGTPADTAVTASTWTALGNDGLGSFTNTAYLPEGVTSLLSDGDLDFSQLALGDAVLVRFDFTVVPTVNGAQLDMRVKLGTGAGEYFLPRTVAALGNGAGIEYRFVEVVNIYMGDDNTRANPGQLQLLASEDVSVSFAGWYAQILRRQGAA